MMEFQSEKAIELIREALSDEDLEVRMYAKEALERAEANGM